MATQKKLGEIIPQLTLNTINDQSVTIPSTDKYTHLQFRRFAGCPVCNLHLQSFFKHADAIKAHGIEEVIVFHASKEKMLENVVETSFNLVADPNKKLYEQFGLKNSWKALLNPSVVTSAVKGLNIKPFAKPEKLETELVVPADFLIDKNGKIVALKYGKHADDQWSVDKLLSLVS